MRYFFYLLILSVIVILSSCDCFYKLSGVVIDKNTRRPISNVAIGKTDTTDLDNPINIKNYTDNKGVFNIYGVSRRCKKNTMFFSSSKYLTVKKKLRNGTSDTIYLEQKGKTFDIKSEIQNIVGTEWLIERNDSLEFSHPYLKTGEYLFTLTANHKSETIELLLYASSDSTFENEITKYHVLASCSLSKDNYKFKYYKKLNYFLFLPFYPCWDTGYSESGKEMIREIFDN